MRVFLDQFEAQLSSAFKASDHHHRFHVYTECVHVLTNIPFQTYLKLNYYRMRALQAEDAAKQLSANLKILLEAEVCCASVYLLNGPCGHFQMGL